MKSYSIYRYSKHRQTQGGFVSAVVAVAVALALSLGSYAVYDSATHANATSTSDTNSSASTSASVGIMAHTVEDSTASSSELNVSSEADTKTSTTDESKAGFLASVKNFLHIGNDSSMKAGASAAEESHAAAHTEHTEREEEVYGSASSNTSLGVNTASSNIRLNGTTNGSLDDGSASISDSLGLQVKAGL